MKIDTVIDIAKSKRLVDLNEEGKVNPTYRRLMHVLMVYKKVHEVETVDEMLNDSRWREWEIKFLRLPGGGRKTLRLFKDIVFGLGLYDYEKYLKRWN